HRRQRAAAPAHLGHLDRRGQLHARDRPAHQHVSLAVHVPHRAQHERPGRRDPSQLGNSPGSPAMTATEPLLHVQNVNVGFHTARGYAPVITDVSFTLRKVQTLAIVGESGSGKSALAKTIMQILPGNARISEDSRILWHGKNLVGQKEDALRRLRGKSIGMVFQDPMSSLNPFRTIGWQLTEGMRLHLKLGQAEAMRRAVQLLDDVGLSSPAARISQYPHELSGGMRQRVIIAMAIACEPELLIADEPTTALDVTIQAQVLELLAGLQESLNLSVILITHDLCLVAGLFQRVAVIFAC